MFYYIVYLLIPHIGICAYASWCFPAWSGQFDMDWIYTRNTENDMQAEISDPLLIREGFTAAINAVQYSVFEKEYSIKHWPDRSYLEYIQSTYYSTPYSVLNVRKKEKKRKSPDMLNGGFGGSNEVHHPVVVVVFSWKLSWSISISIRVSQFPCSFVIWFD